MYAFSGGESDRLQLRTRFGYTAISTTPAGEIVVLDSRRNTLIWFSLNGVRLRETPASPTSGPQQRAEAMTVGEDGSVWTSDFTNWIHRFDSTGELQESFPREGYRELKVRYGELWGAKGTAVNTLFPNEEVRFELKPHFDGPDAPRIDFDFGPSGDLFVLDRRIQRVLRIRADGSPATSWGSYGDALGELEEAMSIRCDELGRVFIAEPSNYRIQVFSEDGTSLCSWIVDDPTEPRLSRPARIHFMDDDVILTILHGEPRFLGYRLWQTPPQEGLLPAVESWLRTPLDGERFRENAADSP